MDFLPVKFCADLVNLCIVDLFVKAVFFPIILQLFTGTSVDIDLNMNKTKSSFYNLNC